MNINNLSNSYIEVLKQDKLCLITDKELEFHQQASKYYNKQNKNQNQTRQKKQISPIKNITNEQEKKKLFNNIKKIENLQIIQEQEDAQNNVNLFKEELYYEASCSPKQKELRGQFLPQIRKNPNSIQLIQKFDLYQDQCKIKKSDQTPRKNLNDKDSLNYLNQSVQNQRDTLKPVNVNILIDKAKNQKIMRYENNLLKLLNSDKNTQKDFHKIKTNKTNPDVLQNTSFQYYQPENQKPKLDKQLDVTGVNFNDLLRIEELDNSKIKNFQPEKLINPYQPLNDQDFDEKYQHQLKIIKQKQQDLQDLVTIRDQNQQDITQNIIKQKIKYVKNSIHRNTQNLNLYATFQKEKKEVQINLENEIRASSMNIQYRLQKEKEKNQEKHLKKKQKYSEDSVKDDTTVDTNVNDENELKSQQCIRIQKENFENRSNKNLNETNVQNYQQNLYKRKINNDAIVRKKIENQIKQKYSKVENQFDSEQIQKCNQYFLFIQMINFSNNQIVNAPSTDFQPYKIYVAKGNNSQLVRNIFKQRWWWSVVRDENIENIQLFWSEYGKNSQFQKMQALPLPYATLNHNYQFSEQPQILSNEDQKTFQDTNKSLKNNSPYFIDQIQKKVQLNIQEKLTFTPSHNHLEKGFNLSDKKALFYNIKNFALASNQDPFQFIPLTFHIKDGIEDKDYLNFLEVYNKQKENKQANIWIIKPGEITNRGTGISVHTNLDEINQIILKDCHYKQNSKVRKTYIVQQYLDKPFLYNKRKFDIRAFLLMTSQKGILKGYWFQEGYARTSSKEYTTKNLANKFIHLTNDAIQIQNEEYGKFENGNKVSYNELQKYIDQQSQQQINFQTDIHVKMRECAQHVMKCVYGKIDPQKLDNSFEIFGLDFMIDEKYKTFLIEVNTNPCLETSGSLLARIIPQMVENALKIAVDPIFPPPNLSQWDALKMKGFNQQMTSIFENNKFELIFDERIEGEKLKDFYMNPNNLSSKIALKEQLSDQEQGEDEIEYQE